MPATNGAQDSTREPQIPAGSWVQYTNEREELTSQHYREHHNSNYHINMINKHYLYTTVCDDCTEFTVLLRTYAYIVTSKLAQSNDGRVMYCLTIGQSYSPFQHYSKCYSAFSWEWSTPQHSASSHLGEITNIATVSLLKAEYHTHTHTHHTQQIKY